MKMIHSRQRRIKMVKKYLNFEEVMDYPENKKTKVFVIENKVTKQDIGEIKWNGAWRQYCFYPESETFWARGCLREIAEFIDKLMEDRK